MSKTIIARANKPKGGLRAGSHTFRVDQTVSLPGDETQKSILPQEIVIDVRLERFQPPEIVFRYPLPGSHANFEEVIPHLVLGHAGLPWEHSAGIPLKPNANPNPEQAELATWRPWLALFALPGGSHEIRSGTVKELITSCEGTWVPSFEIASGEKDRPCRYVDLPTEDFCQAAPRLFELDRLTHVQQPVRRETQIVRRASLDSAGNPRDRDTSEPNEFKQKEILTLQDQMTSVLLNRRPVSAILEDIPAEETQEIDIFLVSLEGYAPLLKTLHPGPAAIPEQQVRLLVLDHWSFTHASETSEAGHQGTLQQVCQGLTVRSLQGADDQEPGSVRFDSQGDRPLYYHSPLLPEPADPDFTERTWEAPDECLFELNSGKGIDVSYAAAWQMGRLVAMGDPALGELFARVRVGWRYLSAVRARGGEESPDPIQEASNETLLAMSEEDRLAGVQISRLWLLEKVPLHYLVPNPAWLPPESFCPVFLDRMWADAWCWGAFSAGSHSPTDFPLGSSDGMKLMAAEGQLGWRARGVSGLLIRSRLISDWPRAIVDFFEAGVSKPIVRQAKIAPDVLLLLVEGAYDAVEIKSPPDANYFHTTASVTLNPEYGLGSADLAEDTAFAESPIRFEFTHE